MNGFRDRMRQHRRELAESAARAEKIAVPGGLVDAAGHAKAGKPGEGKPGESKPGESGAAGKDRGPRQRPPADDDAGSGGTAG
jgi:hypothetical protein